MSKRLQKDSAPVENYSNKIFQTLVYLNEVERKRLLKYFRSPYFVQSKPLMALCEALLFEIEKGSTGFDRQVVWQKLFPKDGYDDVNFRKYCSDLLKHTKAFMAHEVLSENSIHQAIDTLEFVVEHKIEPLYKGAIRDARDLMDAKPYRSLNHFRSAYRLERQYFSMMEFDVKVDTRTNLEEISNNLDLFYWIEKLKISSSALSQRKTGNQDYNISFIEEVRIYLSTYPIEKVPELAIYFHSFMTLYEEEDVAHYYNLKRLLKQYGAMMPQKEVIELTDSALHYCTGKMNTGHRVFLQEYFDLFETTLEKGIFFQKGILATWRLNNIVGVSLRLGKFNWAENFIQTYHVYLSLDTRENTYSFNLARVYRYQGEFNKVLELLINVEYEDIGYNLISKAMLLITYYELQEIGTLLSFTSSFRTFLTRHKNIPPPRRLGYLNLIKYTRRLIRLNPLDKAAVAKLREEITREKASTINHEWLLEKLS